MTRPGIFGILQTYRALLGHGVPNQKYDSHFSCVTPRGLFLVNPTRGHCFLISFSPGCYDFRVVFCFDFLPLRLVQLFHNQFILNQPNKPEPKQRAEPLNFALPGEQGLEEHSTGFSGVGVECSGALLSGALLSGGFSHGLLVIAPRSASRDRLLYQWGTPNPCHRL